ncbi:MAG: hypothetical protein ACRD1Z_14880, partial [Vicinamibacteria bacterium]
LFVLGFYLACLYFHREYPTVKRFASDRRVLIALGALSVGLATTVTLTDGVRLGTFLAPFGLGALAPSTLAGLRALATELRRRRTERGAIVRPIE